MEKEIEIIQSLDCGDDIELKQALEHLIQAYKEQQAELEKKDKIIDKMAEYLASIDFDQHCAEVPGICMGCPREDDLDGYMQCIKHYFERKVEDDIK